MVVRTYAPVGKTPILKENLTRDHLSVMSGITLDGKLYMLEQERAFEAQEAHHPRLHKAARIRGLGVCAEINRLGGEESVSRRRYRGLSRQASHCSSEPDLAV